MSHCIIYPSSLSGSIIVPGDKSISQRAALLASIAVGNSNIEGFLNGEDAKSTLMAVEKLGAKVNYISDTKVIITGTSGKFKNLNDPLNLGNSGTGTRLLAGLLAGIGVNATLIGDSSLSSRPMMRIKEPLEKMGASISITGKLGTLPMVINGGSLNGITYRMPVSSAQVKSCLLFAGLFAKGKTTIIESRPTRDHTEKLFKLFKIPITVDNSSITIDGNKLANFSINGQIIKIPGDFSSAAFWLVAAAVRPNQHIKLTNVGLNPRRTALINVLKRMGATLKLELNNKVIDPVGDIDIYGNYLKGTIIEGNEIPNLIDELPIIAVAASLASGETIIKDAAELRVKESDRIHEMVKNLTLYGVNVRERDDGMIIQGGGIIKTPTASINCKGDHRIAMSLAILNLYSNEPLMLEDIECVDTSYPDFWNHMIMLGGKVEKYE